MINAAPASSDWRALARARRAVQCLPFKLAFYQELESGALSSSQLQARSDWQHLSHRRLGRRHCEELFIWLIQLGVLRREVDGQGLTERVRLTPLGREVLGIWPRDIPAARPWQRMRHWLGQHRPRL